MVWGCPVGIDPLGIDGEELICREFLTEELVTMCTLSDGTIAELPKSELDPIGYEYYTIIFIENILLFNSVSVTFILHDEVTFQPLTSSNALSVLQQTGALSALQSGGTSTGVEVCSFEAGMICTCICVCTYINTTHTHTFVRHLHVSVDAYI